MHRLRHLEEWPMWSLQAILETRATKHCGHVEKGFFQNEIETNIQTEFRGTYFLYRRAYTSMRQKEG